MVLNWPAPAHFLRASRRYRGRDDARMGRISCSSPTVPRFFMPCIQRRVVTALALSRGLIHLCGCGFNRIQPTPTGTIEGITFQPLAEIHDDDTFTDDQKRQASHCAIDAPDTPEGDPLVE